MLLRSVEITDYLSVKGTTTVLLDASITVLLGSNDHGKSNLLKAIQHLNLDQPITEDEVNWDAETTSSLNFYLNLSGPEKSEWVSAMRTLRL
jgi:predicted ATP-dependent endonuclease of OLD family